MPSTHGALPPAGTSTQSSGYSLWASVPPLCDSLLPAAHGAFVATFGDKRVANEIGQYPLQPVPSAQWYLSKFQKKRACFKALFAGGREVGRIEAQLYIGNCGNCCHYSWRAAVSFSRPFVRSIPKQTQARCLSHSQARLVPLTNASHAFGRLQFEAQSALLVRTIGIISEALQSCCVSNVGHALLCFMSCRVMGCRAA